MERKAGGDMATHYAVTGTVQGRHDLECDRRHPRCGAGHRPCAACFVLCGGCDENLRLLCGVETAGARPQSVYPLRPCQSRRHIRLRTDDRSVQHRAGADLHHHERRRFWRGAGNRAACRDRDRRRGLRLF